MMYCNCMHIHGQNKMRFCEMMLVFMNTYSLRILFEEPIPRQLHKLPPSLHICLKAECVSITRMCDAVSSTISGFYKSSKELPRPKALGSIAMLMTISFASCKLQ
ncbi:hypothetical protein HS088_TW02G00279 [Tripterygium wilfordii]|uniref:Uncharacterized protein n=1 Tax=Tripterygium wilfordii TaxID=458696 RepID=A0A7J7DY58_TRIWF|nr:hypothetical protein HS088_TW02G00279 [Tripterygium wilfordii]